MKNDYSNIQIKICGITTISDAQKCVTLGANLLGFNFYKPSSRYVDPLHAATIIATLPKTIVNVGVFVNMPLDELTVLLKVCPLDIVQLHGDETNEHCQAVKALGVKVLKAVRVRNIDDINQSKAFDVDGLLLDAYHESLYGGSGDTFDWGFIQKAGCDNLFLAGGITCDNIAEALQVGTQGIDLCSGVESSGGIKDHAKLEKLFTIIQRQIRS